MPHDVRDVDPRELRLPWRRGADPFKLQRRIVRFGASAAGMPAPWVDEASDGVLVLYNRITRSTRIAKLAPGLVIRGAAGRDDAPRRPGREADERVWATADLDVRAVHQMGEATGIRPVVTDAAF